MNADTAGRFIDQTLHRLVAIGIRRYANEYEMVLCVAWFASLGNCWEGMHPGMCFNRLAKLIDVRPI